jgi:hypothetical protein
MCGHTLPVACNAVLTRFQPKGRLDPADNLFDEAALRGIADSRPSPFRKEMTGVIGPVKRATASRLGKAGVVILTAKVLAGWDGRPAFLTPGAVSLTARRERHAA